MAKYFQKLSEQINLQDYEVKTCGDWVQGYLKESENYCFQFKSPKVDELLVNFPDQHVEIYRRGSFKHDEYLFAVSGVMSAVQVILALEYGVISPSKGEV